MALSPRTSVVFVPRNAYGTSYHGLVQIGQTEHVVRVDLGGTPEHPQWRGARLLGSSALRELLSSQMDILQAKLELCESIEAFTAELEDVLEKQQQQKTVESSQSAVSLDKTPTVHASFYAGLMDELDAVGWDFVFELDDHSVVLCIDDSSGQRHTVRAIMFADFPAAPPRLENDYGVALRVERDVNGRWLTGALRHMNEIVARYQHVWQVLRHVDESLWVLDAEATASLRLSRRIVLANLVLLELTFHPERPETLPSWRFLGSEANIAPLRSRWHANRALWSTNATTRENLEVLLGFPPPTRPTETSESGGFECGICYAYSLEDELTVASGEGERTSLVPDVLCANQHCGRPFHRPCLIDWFRADPTARQSLGVIFGQCPYCEQSISASTLASRTPRM
ncbi:WD-repeat region-domain-containing protein [Thamnocephalis sphaerospora]|uniref:WD-repeat region-domain-containing protein n=1 Tax=Thamnocephalis sphaerospora TaxID=78915 RepID=A0A4P9XVF3_9FUNG|nr:WD-repeat region-domain-containing protein [Thamnocephalis sphaerospora]|eukprot:RKP10238.1 WD-repeat region-domain-containing protein [Thamnocephalis sphaerospora]